jgi:hypothetical protein
MYQPASYWLQQSWGNLKLLSDQPLPDEFPPSTAKNLLFKCSCGSVCKKYMPDVKSGRITSCGHCNDHSKNYWLQQKWGKYSLQDHELPDVFNLMSDKKFIFQCNCGRVSTLNGAWIVSGNTTSCGKCDWKSKKYWLNEKWGSLRLDPNQQLLDEWGTGTSNPFLMLCDCGRSISNTIHNVLSKRVSSCGRCDWKSKDYWLSQKWNALRIDPNQSLPDEWGVSKLVYLICDCGGRIKSNLFNVIHNRTISCGCSKGQGEFSPESEIRKFVAKLAPDVVPATYTIPGIRKKYDVYVPSVNLAIEHHGLIWHSEKFQSPKQDYKKFLIALNRGDRLVQVYADEWKLKKEIIKTQLREILAPVPKHRIKPNFETYTNTPSEARAFLEQHHYLGAASGCLTVLAKHHKVIVGVWIFMKRESKTVLWHRACWDCNFKSWNPHERALIIARPLLSQMGFTRMVTFADNRFHVGTLYEKLGFTFEKELKPDYQYTNGVKRVSKYALRVPAGTNEKSAATKKGWYRIWDSGKKRYSISL